MSESFNLNDVIAGKRLTPDAIDLAHELVKSFPEVTQSSNGRRKTTIIDHMFNLGWSATKTVEALRVLTSSSTLLVSANGHCVCFMEFIRPTQRNVRCAYCKQSVKHGKATKDHVVPRGQGGPNVAENIVLACKPCNEAKANRTPEEWARDILSYRQPFKHKPMTILPLRFRLQLAFSTAVSFLVAVFSNQTLES